MWSNRRFSPEVVDSFNKALDEMKQRWDITEFNLIGYDGGANIVAALAASRDDVASIRTVAGTLTPAVSYDPKTSPLDADSITAFGIAPELAKTPQHHFIGAGDEIAPAAGYHSFRQQMGESQCVRYTFVQDADHTRGWVEKWPELLKATVECEPEYVPVPLPPRPVSKDGPNK
jgi:predicted esterase